MSDTPATPAAPAPHVPNDDTRATVRRMAEAQEPRNAIAAALGISRHQLRDHYADVLEDFPAPEGPPEGRRFAPGRSGNPSGMSGTVAQAIAVARAESADMMRLLASIARDHGQSGPARVSAAKEVLDRALGKAPATVNVKSDLGEYDDDGLDAAIRAEALRLGLDLVHVAATADAAGGEGEADGGEGTARVH